MKTSVLILTILASQVYGEVVREADVRSSDAATNESLAKKYRAVSLEDPMKKFEATKGEDPSVVNKVGNLLENSELVTFNGQTTLVPKNAIIKIPEKFAGRINKHIEGAKIVGWLDFLSTNRGWITTIEVTLAQAKGEVPVSPDLMETASKSGNLLVAVLQGGPISVIPPKVEESPATPTQTPQVKP